MIFSSVIFVFLFLPIVLLLYYIFVAISRINFLKSIYNVKNTCRNIENIILFIASIFFYAWGEPKFVIIMLFSIVFNYLSGMLIERFRKNKVISLILMLFIIASNLSVLFLFKYLNFFITNINILFNLDIMLVNIRLPIGISFFTFQAISYVIDVYRKDVSVQKNILNVGLYISFFPQLIAGPIVRYKTISMQINDRVENMQDFTEGVYRFIIGFIKKILLSNNLALIADKAFSMKMTELSFIFSWLGAIAYTFQIYYDFSGYSDMAIGLGRMFGFKFDENFNYPYISRSISEFWRRWHISLGQWFRDYIYIPMGGSRVKNKSKLVFNLFVVWILTGIWHGANWTFVLWGMIYFVFIAFEKLSNFEKRNHGKLKNIISYIYTMIIVVFCWVIFRSENISYAIDYIKAMLCINVKFTDSSALLYFKENIIILAISVLACMPLGKEILNKLNDRKKYIVYFITDIVLLFLFVVSISYLIKGVYNPFIYFNF